MELFPDLKNPQNSNKKQTNNCDLGLALETPNRDLLNTRTDSGHLVAVGQQEGKISGEIGQASVAQSGK